MGQEGEAEKLWIEALRSNTTIENYLRLRLESKNYANIEHEVETICDTLRKQKISRYSSYRDDELKENELDSITNHLLLFFKGDFQHVAEHGMNEKEALGWSFTFMKIGLALFLLLLLEKDTLEVGGCAMLKRAVSESGFDAKAYENGTLKNSKCSDDNDAYFWKCFCKWKESIYLSEAEKAEYTSWVEKLIEKRVQGIMDANKRNYYGECASYIAALGEVKESAGETNGKQQFMQQYRAKYSRRSAFRKELREYGLKE